MKRMTWTAIAGMAFGMTAVPIGHSNTATLWAQPPQAEQDQQRTSPIGERHRLIERKMAELETKFELIAHALEKEEPERAQKLVEALQQAKEKLIAKNMSEITQLLDQQKLDQAEAELDAVILNLEELVRLLLNEKQDEMSRRQEMEMLQRWRDQIQQIQREQHQQTRETSKVANKDETLRDLDAQIKAVQELIKKQQTVIDETEEHADSGIQALDRIANRQFDVRAATEDLAQTISGQPKPDPVAQADKNDPGSESKDKTGDAQPGDPSAQKSQGSQSQDSQPGQGKNASESPSSESQSPSAAKEPGQQPLESAATQQQSAEQKLTSGKAAEAKRAEQTAKDQLEKALEELNKEKRRLASLPPEAFEKMARDQNRTGDKTADVAKEMSKAPKPSDQDKQNANAQKSNGGQPGQQNMQQAKQAMDNASGDLSEQEPQKAERQQEKAEEELEKALREIEERLNQLREETQAEKLARLEARFREMLMRQQVASLVTLELDDKHEHLNRLRRRDLLTLLRVSTEELEISELGQQAYDLLLEDGTSVVFPEVVQDVREDLIRVGQLLETEQTGPLTQLIQGDIESTLEELLEALKQTRREGQSGGGGGGGGGNQPLLRKSAELKMLRQGQLRVNRLTGQVDLLRHEDTLDSDDLQKISEEIEKISQRQAELVDILGRLIEDK